MMRNICACLRRQHHRLSHVEIRGSDAMDNGNSFVLVGSGGVPHAGFHSPLYFPTH